MTNLIAITTEGMRHAANNVVNGTPLPFEIVVQPLRHKRSLAQNRLYWKWLTVIAQQMKVDGQSFSKEEWNHLCGMKFIGIKTISIGDKEFPMPLKSTKDLKVNEFAEYLTQIESHFIQKGVNLTYTDDYGQAVGKE